MARKVFISFLGTNDYLPVYYTDWDTKLKLTDKRTKFIQEALIRRLCKDFGPDDCIMIFRTDDSNDENWKDSGNKVGLENILKSIRNLQCRINPEKDSGAKKEADSYMIPVGFDEDQMWEIFNCVYEKLEPYDEIYFDVTHAFRTIPLFVTVLFNYAGFLKHTVIKGVYYGAFEKLGPLGKLRQLPDEELEKLEAPVVDLTNLVRLQEINTIAGGFRDFGSLRAFSNNIYSSRIHDLDPAVAEIAKALDHLDSLIQTSQINGIYQGDYMVTIKDKINEFRKSPHTNDAQYTLLLEILKTLEDYGFTPEASDNNTEAAIKWAVEHRMIQQAYTMAQEYMITRVQDLLEYEKLREDLLNEFGKKRNTRNFHEEHEVRNAIGKIIQNAKGTIFLQTGKTLVESYPVIERLSPHYTTIVYKRNELNHAGTTSVSSIDFEHYERIFRECWKECKILLDSM